VSDLRTVASDGLRSLGVGDGSATAKRPARRVELWHGIAAGLLFLLLLEAALSVFGGRLWRGHSAV
jgi:hypothetical protein